MVAKRHSGNNKSKEVPTLPGLPVSLPDTIVGNKAVIELLESALKDAKDGKTLAIGLVSVTGNDNCNCSWVGGYSATVVMGATNLISSIMGALFSKTTKGN